jgi:ATP-dependent protease HslVU (ClpYQ) peptidase subunit
LYSYREVFEFKEFWGIGSGRSFALGAMHALFGKAKDSPESPRPSQRAEFGLNSAARTTCSLSDEPK